MALTQCELEKIAHLLANGLCSVDADGNIRSLADDLAEIKAAIVAQGPNLAGGDGGDGGAGGDGGTGGDGGPVSIGGTLTAILGAMQEMQATNAVMLEQFTNVKVALCEPCPDARERALQLVRDVKTGPKQNITPAAGTVVKTVAEMNEARANVVKSAVADAKSAVANKLTDIRAGKAEANVVKNPVSTPTTRS